ncbi:MAG: aldehyde dehydrogenase family protein [Saprospiraceae bacterium]|nr:aldehyde dehydrogenase family protein [Saprospiraceae bacterium]
MSKILLPAARWELLESQLKTIAPEMFNSEGRVLNHIAGEWKNSGHAKPYLSPVDGTELGHLPMLSSAEGKQAVQAAALEFADWRKVDLDTRRAKVAAAVAALRQHRDLLAYLLTWEIGKPVAQSRVSVDRCIEGVEWYLEKIEDFQQNRPPLGVMSNIASWNYPMSVLFHTMLVQALCGNAVVAKVPTDGGLYTLSLAVALARRAGLPFTLISGSGGELSEALIESPELAAVSYVGGKSHGRGISLNLIENRKRYMLEMEGVNPYGIWEYSHWADLEGQIKKGYEYAKQRCTAYPRWVVQRHLFPEFLDTYMSAVRSLRIGHPLLVEAGATEAPLVDFGPLINNRKVEELRGHIADALSKGAVKLHKSELNEAMFLPGQDISAYLAPVALLGVPKNAHLYYNEPFGPVDTFIVVDTLDELVNEMNISNGNLVSSIATDNRDVATRVAPELRSFKYGINKLRSRGDKEEAFGGLGQSWKGCYVGGEYLVQALTEAAPGHRLYGNFHDYTLLPEGVN